MNFTKLADEDVKILYAMRDGRERTTNDVALKVKLQRRQAAGRLKTLRKREFLESSPFTGRDHLTIWRASPAFMAWQEAGQ